MGVDRWIKGLDIAAGHVGKVAKPFMDNRVDVADWGYSYRPTFLWIGEFRR
jgi:hypothetical protein